MSRCCLQVKLKSCGTNELRSFFTRDDPKNETKEGVTYAGVLEKSHVRSPLPQLKLEVSEVIVLRLQLSKEGCIFVANKEFKSYLRCSACQPYCEPSPAASSSPARQPSATTPKMSVSGLM
ncbi:Hypothetical predicted protein [Cloeon dipterum]|uniref:Uncharacterized protein n=1 Tax=Cloeon dipterum TaxID=197152 RepID=A0A8S1D694_9INSE|nr:Hypothetical predicted protein [Cloeon dipterum]